MGYRNPKLILKEKQEHARRVADKALRESRAKTKLVNVVVEAKKGIQGIVPGLSESLDSLLRVAYEKSDILEIQIARNQYLPGLRHLASWHDFWIRQPEDWEPRSHNIRRQFSSLARHLLCQYPVPAFMDDAWLGHVSTNGREQEWFIHIGMGGNIRKAEKLPYPLTKMMAHRFLEAPDDLTVNEALRWGQVRGMGGSENLANAVVETRLKAATGDENFWLTVVNFLVLHDNMMDMNQIGPMIDYIVDQKYTQHTAIRDGHAVYIDPPHPGFSMQGRTIDTLMDQVNAWHDRLARTKESKNLEWKTCGIEGFDRIEGTPGNQKRYLIEELLSSGELKYEGSKMHHCVYSYAHSCLWNRCAIYSMKEYGHGGGGIAHRVTIEVDPRTRQIVQVRAKYNDPATPVDRRILQAWATARGLTFGRWTTLR